MNEKKPQKPPKRTGLIIFLILLVIAQFATIGWLLIDRKKQKEATVKYIETLKRTYIERDSLKNELTDLYKEYEYLKENNDSLQTELTAQQQKIKNMLKKVRTANTKEIEKYKQEIETLRKIMQSYIVQLDSLNRLNQDLTAENIRIKTDYRMAVDENEELQDVNDSLSTTVEKASEVRAINIEVAALNNRDKVVRKIRKLDKIEVCFTLDQNQIAQIGKRFVYIRIARPDGVILSKSPDNRFEFDGESIVYSARRQVDYNGEAQNVCIYWINDEILLPGTYTSTIFMDGNRVGIKKMDLK